MVFPSYSAQQHEIISSPIGGRYFLEGPASTGKTTAGAGRLLHMLYEGVPAESILILVPQRTLAGPYYGVLNRPDLPDGGMASIATLGGLGQRLIELFWPMIAAQAGFALPDKSPTFLTLETAQYYLARLVQPLLDEGGYFESVAIDRNRLLSQILDNLNKAAAVGFDHGSIAKRLKAAWVGSDPAQLRVYDEAQDVASRFRSYCLEHNLLDFSLQLEVFCRHLWPSMLCRQYLSQRFRHLIFDNIEEDVPVVHDVVREWLPDFDSALLVYDYEGGYRSFLGADPESGYSLKQECDTQVQFDDSWVISPGLQEFHSALCGSLQRQPLEPARTNSISATFAYQRFSPQMADWIANEIGRLVHEEGVPPSEIVVMAPFLSDSLRFTLSNRLTQAGVPSRSHRPSRSLRDEPAARALLTLARIAHPQWNLPCSRQDVRYALIQAIDSLDLVRADLLARIAFRENHFEEGLGSFDRILPEMQDRISFVMGERYENLRGWIETYRTGEVQELDVFLSRLFGEVLSQPGFGFADDYDAAAVATRLIESVQKFRWAAGDLTLTGSDDPARASIGREYIRMVESGVLAAQYLLEWNDRDPENAVLLAPAYTFLINNVPASYQFWLDVGSMGWWERLSQPLTHPYVLSRRWQPGAIWTDADEYRINQDVLSRLVTGLLRRCREHIYMCGTGYNEHGDEQRGPLMQAVQTLLRRERIHLEAGHV